MHCVYHFEILSFSVSFPFRLLANVNLGNNAAILKYSTVAICSVKRVRVKFVRVSNRRNTYRNSTEALNTLRQCDYCLFVFGHCE